jgi:hypothetical protein
MIIKLNVNLEKAKAIMDHKIGIRQIDYCHWQKSFSFIDFNFEYVVMSLPVASTSPKLIMKGIHIILNLITRTKYPKILFQ